MLDKIDREIIESLRKQGRLSYRELGDIVCLSANTVADRVRRLADDGVLQGFAARVNLAALDLTVQAYIDIKILPTTSADQFEAVLQSIPGIVEASLLTGAYDYLLRVVCRDHAALVNIIEELRARAGVQDTQSRVILRRVEVQAPLSTPG